MHWIVAGLDRGRFHWSDNVPDWPQAICLFTLGSAYALALWAMRVNRFFSSVIRIQTDRGQQRHHGTLRLRPPSRIHRRDSDHSGKRTRTGIVACGRVRCDLQPAVSTVSRIHRGSNSSGTACRLFGLRRAGPMAAHSRNLVRAQPQLGRHAPQQTSLLPC